MLLAIRLVLSYNKYQRYTWNTFSKRVVQNSRPCFC